MKMKKAVKYLRFSPANILSRQICNTLTIIIFIQRRRHG
jgi:hypothetical protein